MSGLSVGLIVSLIKEHGIAAVIIGMIIEEVFVPIPSPVIPMAAGALLIETSIISKGVLQILFLITIPASIASVLSSYFVYSIAFYGGEPIIKKYGKLIDVKWNDVKEIEKYFDHGGQKYFVAILRAIPIVPLSLISGSAGLFKMDWKTYGIWSFIGMLPRNFVLAFIGWQAKENFLKIASLIDKASLIIILAIIIPLSGFIAYRNIRDLYMWVIKRIMN